MQGWVRPTEVGLVHLRSNPQPSHTWGNIIIIRNVYLMQHLVSLFLSYRHFHISQTDTIDSNVVILYNVSWYTWGAIPSPVTPEEGLNGLGLPKKCIFVSALSIIVFHLVFLVQSLAVMYYDVRGRC